MIDLIRAAGLALLGNGFLTVIKEWGDSYSFGMVVMIPLFVSNKFRGSEVTLPKLVEKNRDYTLSSEYPGIWYSYSSNPIDIYEVSSGEYPRWLCIGLLTDISHINSFTKAKLLEKHLNDSLCAYWKWYQVAYKLGILEEFVELSKEQRWILKYTDTCDNENTHYCIYPFTEGLAFVRVQQLWGEWCSKGSREVVRREGSLFGMLYGYVDLSPLRKLTDIEIEKVSLGLDSFVINTEYVPSMFLGLGFFQ